MHILRILGRQLGLLFFGLLLIALPMTTATMLLLDNPDTIKQTAQQSGIYRSFVPAVLAESATHNKEDNAKNVLTDKGVQQAATAAITPAVLQNASETFIDGWYGWLNQKTTEPTFRIDLTQPKQQFIANLQTYAQKRAESLPRCSLAQLQQLRNTEDILSLPCLPPGVDPAKAASQFSRDLVNNSDFLPNPVITQKDLPKAENGKTIAQNASGLPTLFTLLQLAPWIIGGLIVLTGMIVVLLYENRAAGVRRIGWSLLWTGVLIVLAYFLFSKILQGLVQGDKIAIANPEFKQAITSAINSLVGAFLKPVGVIGGVYVAVAAILLALQARLHPAVASQTVEGSNTAHATAADDNAETPNSDTQATPLEPTVETDPHKPVDEEKK